MFKKFIFTIFAGFLFFTFTNTAYLQPNSNTNTNSSNTTVSEDNNRTNVQPVVENPRVKVIRDGLKSIADGSKELSGWCLLIIAASIAVIVKTSNFSPPKGKGIRSMYLLFIPGWLFLIISMYEGNFVARRFMAAALTSKLETLQEIGVAVNIDFASQLLMFQIGLIFFIIWLLIYLIWWTYYYEPKSEK